MPLQTRRLEDGGGFILLNRCLPKASYLIGAIESGPELSASCEQRRPEFSVFDGQQFAIKHRIRFTSSHCVSANYRGLFDCAVAPRVHVSRYSRARGKNTCERKNFILIIFSQRERGKKVRLINHSREWSYVKCWGKKTTRVATFFSSKKKKNVFAETFIIRKKKRRKKGRVAKSVEQVRVWSAGRYFQKLGAFYIFTEDYFSEITLKQHSLRYKVQADHRGSETRVGRARARDQEYSISMSVD